MLRENGAEKVNFAGGEPFLYEGLLGRLVRHAKRAAGYPSVSIISNGFLPETKLRAWFDKHGEHLDMLGISCDSAEAKTNLAHGRGPAGSSREKDRTGNVRVAAALVREFKCRFKINTVVTDLNKDESSLATLINEVTPDRWKIFQVLDIKGENSRPPQGALAATVASLPAGGGRSTGRTVNAHDLRVSNATFHAYVERNRAALLPALQAKDLIKAEDNATMRSSYIIVDEFGRFLDNSRGDKTPTRPILDGIDAAAEELLGHDGTGFDRESFYARDGFYPATWAKHGSASA